MILNDPHIHEYNVMLILYIKNDLLPAIANRLTLPGGLVLKELDMYLTETQFNALNAKT